MKGTLKTVSGTAIDAGSQVRFNLPFPAIFVCALQDDDTIHKRKFSVHTEMYHQALLNGTEVDNSLTLAAGQHEVLMDQTSLTEPMRVVVWEMTA
jgi:hypothetical protein